MKRFLMSLLLFPAIAVGQYETQNQPIVSATTIANCVLQVGEDTVSAVAKPFGSVAVGQYVFGPGVPWGTKVESLVDADLDSAIILDQAITASGTVSLQFGYFTSAAHGSGDWLGFPFLVRDWSDGETGVCVITGIEITDNSSQLGATDVIFFSGGTGSEGLDNVAIAYPAANEAYVLGIVSLTVATDLGSVNIVTKDDFRLVLPKTDKLWARLVVRSTPTLTAVNNLRVRIRFE